MVFNVYSDFERKMDSKQREQLRELLSELKPLNFTDDYQLSEYIRINKLGEVKYHSIGAALIASNGVSDIAIKGFPDEIYAYLNKKLGLTKKPSAYRVIHQEPNSDNLK